MCNIDWLNKVASDPIKLNLLYMNGEEVDCSYYEEKLLDNPQVRYWIDQLKQAVSKPIAKIHGSHDYRYENIMGKLYTLGVRRGMKNFDKSMLVEQTDGFFIFGKHMGVGEDRKDSKWVEIESTYWMEKIASQKIHKNY